MQSLQQLAAPTTPAEAQADFKSLWSSLPTLPAAPSAPAVVDMKKALESGAARVSKPLAPFAGWKGVVSTGKASPSDRVASVVPKEKGIGGEKKVEEKEPEEKEKAEEKKPEEQKVEEKPEEKEEKGTPDLEVKNNGIEIKMWMKCEEGSCVLDVERSGSYDSFNDLTDCETSVKVKCRNRTYSVPMPKSVDKTIFVSSIVSVSVATVCER